MQYFAIIFWILQIVTVPMFIKSGWPKSKKSTLYIKMVSSTVFVGYAIFNIFLSDAGFGGRYQQLILIGLVLGWIGDVFMTFDPFLEGKPKSLSDTVALIGGASFLAGHIFFISAFIKAAKFEGATLFGVPFFIALAVLMVLLILTKIILKLKLGKFAIPVAVYALMIDFMFSSGLSLAVGVGGVMAFITLGVGTLLFVVSDFNLGLKIFDGERFNTLSIRTAYIVTYYIAQMLIAASLLVI